MKKCRHCGQPIEMGRAFPWLHIPPVERQAALTSRIYGRFCERTDGRLVEAEPE